MLENYLFLIASFVISITLCHSEHCGCQDNSFDFALINHNNSQNDFQFIKIDDMLLDKYDWSLFKGMKTYNPYQKTWPGNTVFYYFNTNDLNEYHKNSIRRAFSQVQDMFSNCIKFVEQRQSDSVEINDLEKSCSATIGYLKGHLRKLNLHRSCNKDIIIHEIFHVLGLYHIQNRPDRDQYVNVKANNIVSKYCQSFAKCAHCTTDYPYDYSSILSYDSFAFTCDDNPSMTMKNGTLLPYNVSPTEIDIQMIKDLYKC